ncbi:LrgB family protein [uncultured Pseudoteredinibacter sp.]|uniref:LrgB family protein n=1 Tax=uncultured Pseudoteredinibacter sp. TaxID=1641701 RepID=UPI00262435A6|nr:LrgB family protein [uncultured Pseudoteredinibacter sp.]
MIEELQQAFVGFTENSQLSQLSAIILTLGAYQFGQFCYQRSGRLMLLHPVVIAGCIIAAALNHFDISYQQYRDGSQLFYFLLGPATVALAIPLYQEFRHIRLLARPVLITVALGATIAAASAVLLAGLIGAEGEVLRSIASKSVTTPIALGISDKIHGISTLTTGVVVATGIIGALLAPIAFYFCGLRDPRLQGIVLGLNAHGIGTAVAFEKSPSCGAFASLAMGLTGAFTALTLPYAISYFGI